MEILLGIIIWLLGASTGYLLKYVVAKNKMAVANEKFRKEKEILQIQLKVAMKDRC